MTDSEFPGTEQAPPADTRTNAEKAAALAPVMRGDVSAADYHAGPGVSRSDLVAFNVTPRHYKHHKAKPWKPTAAMELGRLTHMAVLEPEKFAASIILAPDVDRRTKEGKKTWAEFLEAAKGKEICDPDDLVRIRGMKAAIMEHPAAHALLMGADSKREVSLYWKDKETGLLCRCRPDVLRFDGIIPDLKTCEDASPEEAAKACWNFGYDLEATHYTAGLHAVAGIEPRPFPFVFVESKPPHCIAVYVLDNDALEFAEKRRRKLLRKIAECVAADKWPGYPDKIQSLSLPAWAMKTAANDNAEGA